MAYYDQVIAQENERIEKQRNASIPTDPRSLTVHGPDDSKGLSPYSVPSGETTGRAATDLGRIPSTARTGPPKSSAGTAQYGNELMSMYETVLGGPKGAKPTPEELRAKNTKEAYEIGKKLGYWK